MNKVDAAIKNIIEDYYIGRDMSFPDNNQALMFLVSEVGEVADAFVDRMAEWVRNNDRERNVSEEIADVLFMLYVLAMAEDVNPVEEMIKKMKEKLNED